MCISEFFCLFSERSSFALFAITFFQPLHQVLFLVVCQRAPNLWLSSFPIISLQIKDIINEEEAQFLKTLSRGRRLFNRAAEKAVDSSFAGKFNVMLEGVSSLYFKVH